LLSLDPGLDDDDSYEEDIFDEKEMFSSTQLCNMVNAKSPPSSSSSSESEESDTEERGPSLENNDPLFFMHGQHPSSDDGGVVRGPERRALSELKDNKIAHRLLTSYRRMRRERGLRTRTMRTRQNLF